ncbi:MAG: glycosyltransferase, partial [Bacteroidota bacterium]
VTIRMSPFPFKEFLKSESELKDIIRQPLKKANRLITTSESLKNRLSDFSLKHVTVVNNPIDLDFFKIKEKNSRKNRILTVGRMEEQKGIDILLKAIKKLEEPFELTIGGDGSKLLEYKQLCTDLDLDGKVTWLGQLSRDQVAIEMQKCSFYVLSSRHETFGNVILEAMSCGKPVVATRCGGPEEIVTNDTGLLCDISVDDLFAKINHMNKVYPSFDSSKIRKDAIDRYAPEVWIGNLEKVFRGML